MAEKNRNGLRAVETLDTEEYEQKIYEHRKAVTRRRVVAVFVAGVLLFGVWVFMALRHYENFDIRSSIERSDTAATTFVTFQGNVLKYNNDGAFYTDLQNELIWNQTYEMSHPQIDMCEEYLIMYDKKGKMIYIMTENGLEGSIETNLPIVQASVAAQGTVAVLMEKEAAGYLELYDKTGQKTLAEGMIHGANGGYPIAIALSHDAIKLAVSVLDLNSGNVKSTIAFYNYGSVGQNETDNCVGASSFADMAIPEVEFISDDKMIAFGDTQITIFEGSQKPQMKVEIPLNVQVKSVFYNEKYIGVVSTNEGEEVIYHMTIYDTKGKEIMQKDIGSEYETIEFIGGNEICVRNRNICDIYTLYGVHKFHYEFSAEVYQVIPGISNLSYTFILSDATEKVRLK